MDSWRPKSISFHNLVMISTTKGMEQPPHPLSERKREKSAEILEIIAGTVKIPKFGVLNSQDKTHI